jgi:hypothetical protein
MTRSGFSRCMAACCNPSRNIVTFNSPLHYEVMRLKLLFFIAAIFFLSQSAQSQTNTMLFSSIKRTVANKQDSLVLIHNEQKMWQAAKDGNVMMFDNPMMDCEFRVRMSKGQIDYCFKDSLPLKSGAPFYLMNLMENRNADTVYLMSFSPFLNDRFQEQIWVYDSAQASKPDTNNESTTGFIARYGHWEMGAWQNGISVKYLMPLSGYPKTLPAKEMSAADKIYRAQLASQLNGKLSGDTIYRITRFTKDSNEYLPQSPYANFLTFLKNGSLSGELHAYPDCNLSKPMWKMQIENTYSNWDSTNQVEDPNNPGVFILAPLKYEGQVKTLLLYEKWNYFPAPAPSFYYASPYLGCRREVCAYGLLLTGGHVLWFSADEVNKLMEKSRYNFQPYEECFRAERFKALQVQVHTW